MLHGGNNGSRSRLLLLVPAEKEEHLVTLDGTADGAAKLVSAGGIQLGVRALQVIERGERVVLVIFKQRTVEMIAA